MPHGVAGLPDHGVGRDEQPAHRRAQPRMPVRGELFRGIVKITAVDRQHVRDSVKGGECRADGARGHREMRVDHVEGAAAKLQAAQHGHRHIGEHRRKIGHRHLGSEEYRHADHTHAPIGLERREVPGPRGEDGHLVPAGEFTGECGHDDAAPAAERRILVIAEQDPQAGRASAVAWPAFSCWFTVLRCAGQYAWRQSGRTLYWRRSVRSVPCRQIRRLRSSSIVRLAGRPRSSPRDSHRSTRTGRRRPTSTAATSPSAPTTGRTTSPICRPTAMRGFW